MDPKPLSEPTTPISSPKNHNTTQSPIKAETSFDAKLSTVSDITHESSFSSLSPTQSPPRQIMERPDDLDFSNRCSSSSSDWSSVSNESLFSIHINPSDAFEADDLMSFSGESNADSLKVDSLSKLDDNKSNLDEPQKVVRWKTQVEHHPDEGMPSQGHKSESSPLNSKKSSEFINQKPKKKFCWSSCDCDSCKKFCWSSCDCDSCNLRMRSCWNRCWKIISCSNCRTKKVSSHSTEASAPTSTAPKKSDQKHSKYNLKSGCCIRPSSWSCSCSCCEEVNLVMM